MTGTAERPPNRLIDETSPYLLQHARNPVDWHAWGDEALNKSRAEQRPIFLSIGYSACHWCHVMEHESFEDGEIAALMNRYFVNIKVDREERPDLDQIYMNSVTAMTGRGGWPMSVFLTPELKPFYGGTYWPPEPRMGMPGFRQVIDAIHDAWENRRDDVVRGADELTAAVSQMARPVGEPAQLDESLLQNALQSLLNAADRTHGGFGTAPKFPHAMDLRLLLRLWKRFGSDDALQVTRLTLDKMAGGGIYDHLGGGFHRYSTNATWLVPHFEKMLYDNALLCTAYLEAYQATGCEEYNRVVRETLDYVLREMTHSDGGFYSTQDADSEGVEGKFFVWSEDEIVAHLGEEDARIFNACYDVSRAGNWEAKNILNRPESTAEQAAVLDLSEEQLDEVLDRCRRKLFEVRCRRIAPGRDEKILTSWNGLMIAAMSLAAEVLGQQKYADAARQAADFVLTRVISDDGRLLHSYKDGRPRFNAYLDDYACTIDGLVELYQATFETRYLTAAAELCETMLSRFHDAASGGFFYTSDDHETLVVRLKDSQDNATPSGNSMAACALLRLGRLCGRTDLEAKGVEVLEALSGQLKRVPMAASQALIAVDFVLGSTYEVAVVDGQRSEETERVFSTLARRFLPNKVVLRRPRNTADDALPEVVRPLLEHKMPADEAPTIYLCEQGVCREPVFGVEGLESALAGLS